MGLLYGGGGGHGREVGEKSRAECGRVGAGGMHSGRRVHPGRYRGKPKFFGAHRGRIRVFVRGSFRVRLGVRSGFVWSSFLVRFNSFWGVLCLYRVDFIENVGRRSGELRNMFFARGPGARWVRSGHADLRTDLGKMLISATTIAGETWKSSFREGVRAGDWLRKWLMRGGLAVFGIFLLKASPRGGTQAPVPPHFSAKSYVIERNGLSGTAGEGAGLGGAGGSRQGHIYQ